MTARSPHHLRPVLGQERSVTGIAADPIYLDVTVPPGKRKRLPVDTSRNAFAYVFAGSGKFCNASGPLAVPTESVNWLDHRPARRSRRPFLNPLRQRRRSSSPSRRPRHPLPVGIRQTIERTGRLVRPHRHEHPGTIAEGV